MKFLFVIFIFLSLSVSGQAVYFVDTPLVLFRAKLLAFANCGLHYSGGENYFMRSINHTNAHFLKSKGFDDRNLMFIKVELRDRYYIESFLFLNTMPDSEKIEFLAQPEGSYSQFQNERLYERYKITDSTPNRVLDSLLPPLTRFKNKDIFLVFDADRYNFYILNCDCNGTLDDLKEAVVNHMYIDKEFLDKKTRKYINAHKMLPKKIVRELTIEDYGKVDW